MKYNSTYIPKLSLLETLIAINEIQTKIESSISKLGRFWKIAPPMYLLEESKLLSDFNDVSRKVSFDSIDESKIGTLPLNLSNWAKEIIDKLELKNGQGLIYNSQTLWRDKEENTSSTLVEKELVFQLVVPKHSHLEEAKNIAKKIYELVINIANFVEDKYKIRNIYSDKIQFISAQDMENELPNEQIKNRELEFINDINSFIFSSPAKKMYSGKRHIKMPSSLYDLDNQYFLLFKDRVNIDALDIGSVSILATGDVLKKQLIEYDDDQIMSYEFINNWTQKDIKIIEVKFNLPKLMMALLEKGHISEVTSGVNSNEVQDIKKKYNIQTF